MGTLSIVATPIGNLGDISSRALRVLEEADYILAEDTRVTKKLLSHFDIHTPVGRLDAAVEGKAAEKITDLFEKREMIALVTDAGTPAVSDPGARFVAAAHEHGIKVVAIPGPSALTAALSVAGVLASDFLFLGFLPHKKGREKYMDEIFGEKRMVVFYESPHRIEKTLRSLDDKLGDSRQIVIVRELTKVYEEVMRGSAAHILEQMLQNKEKIKGEFVVIVAPPPRENH